MLLVLGSRPVVSGLVHGVLRIGALLLASQFAPREATLALILRRCGAVALAARSLLVLAPVGLGLLLLTLAWSYTYNRRSRDAMG